MSWLTFNSGAAPATPAAGKVTVYSSTDDEMRAITSDGVDMSLVPTPYNYARNSGMWFAQRQTPGTLATYSSVGGRASTCDGWTVSNENASVQYVRTDTLSAPETDLTSRYYGNFTKITSAGKIALAQVIESTDLSELRGQSVRFQLRAKSLVAASATWRLALVQLTSAGSADAVPSGAGLFITAFGAASTDPTLGTNLSYIAPRAGVTPDNGTVDGNAVDITVTSAGWQQFGAVFDVPANAKNLVLMLFSDDDVAATNGVAISEVQLTLGMQTVEWQPLAIQQELARVQRYYTKSFDIDIAPVQNLGLAGAVRGAISVAGATANQPIGVRLPVAMRGSTILATIVFYNPSAANAFVRNTTAGTNATATTFNTGSDQSLDIFFTGIAAWTVAQAAAVHYSVDLEL